MKKYSIKTFEQMNETNNKDKDFNDKIKSYLEKNLSIEISSETSINMTTDGSEATAFEVTLLLDGEKISSDSYIS